MHLKAARRKTYHPVSNDNGDRLIDLCENKHALQQPENLIQTDTNGGATSK